MKIAIIGTNGIPANYGGFETLVENLVLNLSNEYEITVICSKVSTKFKKNEYLGAKLIYIPFKANGWQSIIFDIISILITVKKFDKILILGASGTMILPFLKKYKNKFIFLFGGLDWQRSKWNFIAKFLLKKFEYLGIKYSKYLISDNIGIYEYTKKVYKRESNIIEYGGDHAKKVNIKINDQLKYPFLTNEYALGIGRIQKDNNIEMILNAFNDNNLKLVYIGNWNYSKFGRKLKKKFINNKSLILLDAIYDKNEIDLLRSNCTIYIHGHSSGGTNPTLVEAMSLNLPILAHDNIFNRFTTGNKALYFKDQNNLKNIIKNLDLNELNIVKKNLFEIAQENYIWNKITSKYKIIFNKK